MLARSGVLLGVAVFGVGCGGRTPLRRTEVISGRFAGAPQDGSSDVFVDAYPVVNGTGPFETTRSFQLVVADGKTPVIDFRLAINGNTFDLSNSQAKVSGKVTTTGVIGKLTRAGSNSVDFSTQPTPAPSGAYSVFVNMTAHTISSVSIGGTIGTTPAGNYLPVTATLTTDSGSLPISALMSPDSDGWQEWIVMPNLTVKGGPVGSGAGAVTST